MAIMNYETGDYPMQCLNYTVFFKTYTCEAL